MNNFQKLNVTELQNVSGGRRKGGFNFGSWWRGVQRGTGQFMTGLRDGLAGK